MLSGVIGIYLAYMNALLIGGVVLALFIGLSYCFLYRSYKRIARRCRKKDCGRTGVKRICKILPARDENIVSFKSPEGKPRWFVRRVIKLTFTQCKCGWVELVKIDTDPMSLWHAWWAMKFHKDQFMFTEPKLMEAAQTKMRKLYLGGKYEGLDPQTTDTPTLSPKSLFRDYFEEISEVIDKIQ